MIDKIEGQIVTWYGGEDGEREGLVLKAQAIYDGKTSRYVLLILDENNQLQAVYANKCTVIHEEDQDLLEEI